MLPFLEPGGLDTTCQWIIGGLCLAIVGLSGYVVKLVKEMAEVQEARVKWMQDQHALLKTLSEEFHKKGGGDGRR